MKKIALHDSDFTNFPNLALMKLSAWHKKRGDEVSWFEPLFGPFDIVYSSKVFSYTPQNKYLPETTVKGGSGYQLFGELQNDIEHICPDYSFYNLNYSLGFLTRGCDKKCSHCIVPQKEGKIRPHADIEEFTQHKEVILLDNNVLDNDFGINQIEKIVKLGLKVDFNQGLDARLIDNGMARLLSKVKWLKPIRLACDRKNQMEAVRKAVELLRWHNATPRTYFCYVLIKSIDDALERIKFLKGVCVDPFAQPYIDEKNTPPTKEQKHLARWVNHKAEFKSRTWKEYKKAHMKCL